MNNPRSKFLDGLLFALTELRLIDSSRIGTFDDWSKWGEVRGRIWAAQGLGVITVDQAFALLGLLVNVGEHTGKPFPREGNAGPVMPSSVWFERHKAALKMPTEVPADAPAQVPAQAASTGLRLLCLLDPSDNRGNTRSYPAGAMSPLPPRAYRMGRWQATLPPGLQMRETHAKRPSAEVLARVLKHRQADTFRADTRAFRTGVTA